MHSKILLLNNLWILSFPSLRRLSSTTEFSKHRGMTSTVTTNSIQQQKCYGMKYLAKQKKGLDILFIINLFAADDGYLMYTTGKWWVSIQGFLQHLSLQISLLLEGNEHGSHSHNLLLPLQYFLTVDQYYVERVWTEKLGW